MDVIHIVVHVHEFYIHRLNQLCFELYSWLVEPVNVTPTNKESQLYLSFSNPCKKMKSKEHFQTHFRRSALP